MIKKYLFFNVYIPLLSLFVFPFIPYILLNFLGTLIDTEVQWFVFTFDFQNVNNILYQVVIYAYFFTKYLFFIKSTNEKKEFLKGNIYGDCRWFWYRMARFLGYSKVSLIRKPYHIMYRIICTDLFDIINNSNDNIYDDNEVQIEINEIKKDSSELNLLISDTYQLSIEQIPSRCQKFDTMVINRKMPKSFIRIYSEKLIIEAGNIIMNTRFERRKLNLFLSTSVSNTEQIFKKYLALAGRDYLHLEIFQLNTTKGNKYFKESGVTFKEGLE